MQEQSQFKEVDSSVEWSADSSDKERLGKKIKKVKRRCSIKEQRRRRLRKLEGNKECYKMEPGMMINKFPRCHFGTTRRDKDLALTHDPRVESIAEKHVHNKRVLDIGCGDGNLTLQVVLTYHPLSMTGIDLSKPHINYANKCKEKTRTQGINTPESLISMSNLRYYQANFFLFEAKQGEYETVICIDTFQTVAKTFGREVAEIFVRKVYQILCPKGVLLLQYRGMVKEEEIKGGLGVEEIKTLLAATGFTVKSQKHQSTSKMVYLICTKAD